MKSRFIIQLKRGYYWEDVLIFWDKKSCFVSYMKLLNEGKQVRLIEQIIAFV